MSEELDGIFSARISAHVLERLPDEIDHAERAEIFVAWPRPPRVGSRVHIALAFGDDEPSRHDALVVWSRPPRPGVVGGFRAQLASPAPALVDKLREICETARQRVLMRDVGAPRPGTLRPAPRPVSSPLLIDAPIRERIRRPLELEPESALLRPRPLQPAPIAPAPAEEERPEPPQSLVMEPPTAGDFRFDFGGSDLVDRGDFDLPSLDAPLERDLPDFSAPIEIPQPTQRRRTGTPAPAPAVQELDDMFADLGRELAEAPPPPRPVEQPPPPRPAPQPAYVVPPVIVQFASARSFRMHYDLFLRCGEVYVTHVDAPAPGTPVEVMLEIPDGDVALVVDAVTLRRVKPPEVPKAGWVAKLNDPDGSVTERLATANFIVRD